MANIFPRWMNWLPLKASVVLGILAVGVVAAATYYLPPSYSAVGYQPEQPIPFSHQIHVEQNGMDCRYCHSYVDRAAHSNVPSGETCWGCHQFIKTDSPQLVNLRRAMDPQYEHYDGEPVVWTQIHRTPDYVKFNHSAHINRGVSCVECHGRVDQMEVVHQHEALSMGFCLECHRNPERALRPLEEVTNLGWSAEADVDTSERIGHASQKRSEALLAEVATLAEQLGSLQGEDPASVELAESLEGEISALEQKQELYGSIAEAWNKREDRNRNAAEVEGLGQKEVGLFLEQAWNINPPIQCGGCHR